MHKYQGGEKSLQIRILHIDLINAPWPFIDNFRDVNRALTEWTKVFLALFINFPFAAPVEYKTNLLHGYTEKKF